MNEVTVLQVIDCTIQPIPFTVHVFGWNVISLEEVVQQRLVSRPLPCTLSINKVLELHTIDETMWVLALEIWFEEFTVQQNQTHVEELKP